EDPSVSPSQGWMHYRALQQLGRTDVRFILFPGEKHGPEKLAHQRRKLIEELKWFDRYLFKSIREENEAFKPESPLSTALTLKAALKDGNRYGLTSHGRLIPETVKLEDIEIGRFEVTRAQYSQFDDNYRVESGKENYPACGITFSQAKAYCEWLSRLTGEKYRLGSEEELREIYQMTATTENTLDFWAGYELNPDDGHKLLEKVQLLGTGGPLLKEVGSFQPSAPEAGVFDLGGNAAEWATGAGGD